MRVAVLALSVLAATLGATAQSLPIIPRPAVARPLKGTFLIGRSTLIYADLAAQPIAEWFSAQVRSEFRMVLDAASEAPDRDAIRFLVDTNQPEEGYRLRIDPRGVTIRGSLAGLFYGASELLH